MWMEEGDLKPLITQQILEGKRVTSRIRHKECFHLLGVVACTPFVAQMPSSREMTEGIFSLSVHLVFPDLGFWPECVTAFLGQIKTKTLKNK